VSSGASAPPETLWAEPVAFAPAPANAVDECPATVLGPPPEADLQSANEPTAVPVVAVPEAPAAPAPRIAMPAAGHKPPVAKPVAGVPVAKPVVRPAKRAGRRALIMGGAGAAAILLAGLAFFVWGNRPAEEKGDEKGPQRSGKTSGNISKKGSQKRSGG